MSRTGTLRVKAKDSEINSYPLRLRNISKDFSIDSIKKKWDQEIRLRFFVGYDTIDIRDIEKIHKYLIKRKSIVLILWFIGQTLIVLALLCFSGSLVINEWLLINTHWFKSWWTFLLSIHHQYEPMRWEL